MVHGHRNTIIPLHQVTMTHESTYQTTKIPSSHIEAVDPVVGCLFLCFTSTGVVVWLPAGFRLATEHQAGFNVCSPLGAGD